MDGKTMGSQVGYCGRRLFSSFVPSYVKRVTVSLPALGLVRCCDICLFVWVITVLNVECQH